MRVKTYLIENYHNIIQGYRFKTEHRLYCLDSGNYIEIPGELREIGIEDMTDFEARLGRSTLITYNDIILAQISEVYRVTYDIERCKNLAIIHKIEEESEKRTYFYIELFRDGDLALKWNSEASSYDEAINEVLTNYLSAVSSHK
jgi:hypothetical protein